MSNVLLKPSLLTGASTTIHTLIGDPVDVYYSVAEVTDLVISNNLDGSINPGYPQELQPRDRTSLESKLQVNRIAHDLQPERLSESETSKDGAPIIGPDRVVESGNGRTLGIWRAYAGDQATDYRNWLIENADSYGLNSDGIMAMENPVLVRCRLNDLDRAKFARDSNDDSSVPDKPFLERAMGSLGVDKKKLKTAQQLLDNCDSVSDIGILLRALNVSSSGVSADYSYRIAQTIVGAIQKLKKTTPDNTGALKAYQALTKKLLGSSTADVIEKLDAENRRDFDDVLKINSYLLKASDFRMRFSNGELWQVGGWLKEFANADEERRPDIARKLSPILTKLCGRGRRFDMTYLTILRQIMPAEFNNERPGQVHNTIIIASKKFGNTISAEEAKSQMDSCSAAGRSMMERSQIISRAQKARDSIREEATQLASMMKGTLSQAELGEALRYAPALLSLADYDPEKDTVFGARYSPLSSLFRSMKYASTQRAIARIADVDPNVAARLNSFYAHYQSVMSDINNAVKSQVDTIISESATTEQQAKEWVNNLDISPAAVKDFDARFGKGAIQTELQKIYRLTNGGIRSLRKISFKKNVRAYASVTTGEVVLSGSNDLSVIWHEVGHHFEFSDPVRLQKAKAFLRKKMGDKDVYQQVEGTKNERAIHDSLSETYIGRVYGDMTVEGTDATEVYSMAFQCILDSGYCANSIINNDELLDFFLGDLAKEHQQ